MASGPPTTTGLPRVLHISMMTCASLYCGSIPPVMTRSAHARSASVSSSAVRLTRRRFHDDGSSAASVMRPSGGAGQRAPQTSQTACRFQNELGLNFGNTRSTLGLVVDIDCSSLFACARDAATAVTLRREIAVLDQVLFLLGIAGRSLERMRRGAAGDVVLGLPGEERQVVDRRRHIHVPVRMVAGAE